MAPHQRSLARRSTSTNAHTLTRMLMRCTLLPLESSAAARRCVACLFVVTPRRPARAHPVFVDAADLDQLGPPPVCHWQRGRCTRALGARHEGVGAAQALGDGVQVRHPGVQARHRGAWTHHVRGHRVQLPQACGHVEHVLGPGDLAWYVCAGGGGGERKRVPRTV